MTVALIDGPLGLEAIHTWTAPDGRSLTYPLNDLSAGVPRYKVRRITGLRSRPDADDKRNPRFATAGEVIYPGQLRGKTIVYEGTIQADTLQRLRRMETELVNIFADASREGLMEIDPHATYGTGTWVYHARALQVDVDDEFVVASPRHPLGVYQQNFTLGLRMSDPRFYWQDDLIESGPNADGVPDAIDNDGFAPTNPVFTITVDLGDTPEMSNTSITIAGNPARLRVGPMPAAGELVVNFHDRSVLLDGDDVSGFLDYDYSQWWDEDVAGLQPGTNNVEVNGCTDWSLAAFHASY